MTAVVEHPANIPAVEPQDTQVESATKNPARFGALTHADRCDWNVSRVLREATGNAKCGAQAFVRVVVTEEQHLLFCAHDYRTHAAALAGKGFEIIDESDRINAKPTDPSQSKGF